MASMTAEQWLVMGLTRLYHKGFLYSAWSIHRLLPPGCSDAEACGINDSGAVVGGGQPVPNHKGFLYSAGVYTELLPPGWNCACDYWYQ